MDIKRANYKNKHRKVMVSLIVLAFIFLMFSLIVNRQNQQKLNLSSLWADEVKQTNLTLTAKGFGTLESKQQRYLTAEFNAIVEEIFLKPGEKVTKNSVIIRLSSADIEQAAIQAQLALTSQQANLKQLKLTQKREQLDLNNDLVELKLDLSLAQTQLDAETQLAEQGIVSSLDFKRSQAQVKKLTSRVHHYQQRLQQLKQLQQQAQQIQQDKIAEKQTLLLLAQEKQQKLTVKAGLNGVLQQLPVELGQSLTNGSQLALVGSTEKLIALVSIPHRQVQGISENMSAVIDTRGGKANGVVTRISPIAKEGHVEVEIALVGQLPKNARPALNIEAKINLGVIEQALYLPIPINAKQHSRIQLYKVAKDQQGAQLTWLTLGAKNNQVIEVQAGAKLGDKFILSDMSAQNNQTYLQLTL